MTIAENIFEVRKKIVAAAKKAKRDPSDVELVAVSKTIALECIEEAIEAGITSLGENKIQEAKKKNALLGRQVQWHFIGHLQTNKIKYIFDLFDLIHSVDNFPLAEEINRKAEKVNRQVEVLVQVNISGEETKFGIPKNNLHPFIEKISLLPHLVIKGLMTIPPYSSNPEESRPIYQELYSLRETLQSKIATVSLDTLSMGMSNDYEIAIEEGSTLVRVGTAIFGERHYAAR